MTARLRRSTLWVKAKLLPAAVEEDPRTRTPGGMGAVVGAGDDKVGDDKIANPQTQQSHHMSRAPAAIKVARHTQWALGR